eukprot:2490679-Amphidinium_carterae.1
MRKNKTGQQEKPRQKRAVNATKQSKRLVRCIEVLCLLNERWSEPLLGTKNCTTATAPKVPQNKKISERIIKYINK